MLCYAIYYLFLCILSNFQVISMCLSDYISSNVTKMIIWNFLQEIYIFPISGQLFDPIFGPCFVTYFFHIWFWYDFIRKLYIFLKNYSPKTSNRPISRTNKLSILWKIAYGQLYCPDPFWQMVMKNVMLCYLLLVFMHSV